MFDPPAGFRVVFPVTVGHPVKGQFFQQQLYPQSGAAESEQSTGEPPATDTENPAPQAQADDDGGADLLAGVYYANLLGAREGSDNS